MPELLRLENVWAGYGEAVVLEDISFALEEGDSLSLLGRNGMGKTTLLSTLMGAAHYRSGVMQFAGQDLSAVPAHARAHLGLGWVPQELFPAKRQRLSGKGSGLVDVLRVEVAAAANKRTPAAGTGVGSKIYEGLAGANPVARHVIGHQR